MRYLVVDDLLDLHAFAITHYGGRLGVASGDQIGAIMHTQRQVFFGEEVYPDLVSKAAALLFLISKNRPFVSANEATALLATLRFLAINDARLLPTLTDDDLLTLVRALVRGRLDREALEDWLRAHTELLV